MAGHSKWANIKHRKGAQDAKRGKIFTKIIKEITVSSRIGGVDIESNPRLRKAVENAKANNMPADNIERAIKKGAGTLEGVKYEEVIYEGYGPSGVAILLEVVTDNKNRSVSEIRHAFSKFGGNLAENGSVSWLFEKKGVIHLELLNSNEEELYETALNFGTDEIDNKSGTYEIKTSPDIMLKLCKLLKRDGFNIVSSNVEMLPKNYHDPKREDLEQISSLIELLENNQDVNNIYSNVNFDNKL
jgi:YebC/PmpR family DNA-binding regulatory protein